MVRNNEYENSKVNKRYIKDGERISDWLIIKKNNFRRINPLTLK
jgi:hypothetical protein